MNNLKQLVLPLLCLFIGVEAKSQGINFENSLTWAQIKAKAKTENKYIFVDTYTTWCGPCKAMSSGTFPKKEVGDFINHKFIAVKVQMDQTKSDNESVEKWYTDAKSIDQQYKITVYPTILFFSPDGNLAGRSVGYKDAKELISEASKVVSNSEGFRILYAQYNKGKRDSAFVKKLAEMGSELGQSEATEKISHQYINSLNDIELFKRDNLKFVNDFTTSSNSKGFRLFRRDPKKINSALGNNVAEKKIRTIIVKEEIDPFTQDVTNVPDWGIIENTVRKKYGAIGLEAYYGERMSYASDKKDWTNFGKYYALYYTTAYSRSKFHINNFSWTVFEQISDPKVLEVAVKTMKYDVEHFDQIDAGAYDTYANLLYKAGRISEAIEWESQAVQLEEENASKNNGKPDPVFAETLEKMKAGVKTWQE